MTIPRGMSPVARVAAIITLVATALLSAGCSPDNTSASDADTTTGTTASSSATPETPSLAPTTPPVATATPSTPSASPEVSESTVIATVPGQVILNPEPEVNGDPGGEAWSEVGIGSLTKDAKCNPERKMIELTLNGTTTVRDSEITVIQKPEGLVITTSSVLLATAVIVNDDAAGRLSSTWWNAGGNLSERSILLPGATWEPVIGGGEFRTVKVCSIKE